jgi:hypothetical protein
MDQDNNNINFSHLATVGTVAIFPGLRRTIGIIGLLGLLGAGVLGLVSRTPQIITTNADPVCDRVAWQRINSTPPDQWGTYVNVRGKDNYTVTQYVREANGTGWCIIKHDQTLSTMPVKSDDGRILQMYVNRWYEIPSKYGDRVEQLAPHQDARPLWAMGLGFFSFALLFGIWLPATIIAAIGRRLLRNIQEEPL